MAMASASAAVSQSSCRAQALGLHVCGTSTTPSDGKRGIRSHIQWPPGMGAEKGAAAAAGCRFLGASSSSSSKATPHASNCPSSSCPSSSLKQQHHHVRAHPPCHEQQRGAFLGHCAPLRTSSRSPGRGGAGGAGRGCRVFTRHVRSAVVLAMAVSAASSPSTEELPSLSSLPLTPFISEGGEVAPPPQDASTKASVFAVYDAGKKAQYVGFSKDARNSLRTLLCRRPELCYFYQVFNLPSLDQTQMLAIRSHWFSEIGNPPPGNEQAGERAKWEKPFDAGSEPAAKDRVRQVMKVLAERGLREKMDFNPSLLQEGKCDVIASAESTAASAEPAAGVADSRRRHVSIAGPNGDVVEFDVFYQRKFPTNGGWMYDLQITANGLETTHRVIIGKVYPESVGISEDDFLERTFAFLLAKKLPRRTEGMLTSDQFPVNYFSVSEVEQWYDDFKLMFRDGESLLPGEAGYWRFNRVHKYGPSEDSMPLVGPEN
ncbi:hypothetical protein CBR_g19207 [Chara braunii]|uniref:GIY-YIG domain-containing protein n=1 Tax=Chara braunii TaxID=69332 RepID=A0A388JTL1_CHABU|nr:hypothetical protein CBR_g19207 [Chara braunii]|eukprot:GBG61130.1 hypothetical protein CBR_g19207 [Chara braunii]